jgi:hypothetical protein
MGRIYLDENGKPYDYLAVRNDEIKGKLEYALSILLDEREQDKKGFKKFGYRMSVQLDSCLRSYGLMTAEEFVNIDYDEIEDNWNKFRDLIAYYNLYFDLVANKQLFCAFFRINNRMFARLERHDNEEIRELMLSINDSFIGLGFSASESGGVDSRATKLRLGAKGAGHGVISETEDRLVGGKDEDVTPEILERRLFVITGKTK